MNVTAINFQLSVEKEILAQTYSTVQQHLATTYLLPVIQRVGKSPAWMLIFFTESFYISYALDRQVSS